MSYINRDAKEFKVILSAVGYRRRTVWIEASENVTTRGLNWDGGSRSEYTALTLQGKRVGDMSKYNMMAPWANPGEGAKLPIPPGVVVVKHGFFCGKPSHATIYVNPADMPALLPAS